MTVTEPLTGNAVVDIANELLGCVTVQVEATGGGEIGVANVVHADPTFDETLCCEGYAWVRYVRLYPSLVFPSPMGVAANCENMVLVAEYEVGVARCVPTVTTGPGGRPVAPTPAAVDAAARSLELDALALLQGTLACCLSWRDDPMLVHRRFVVGEVLPSVEDGGCAANAATVTVRLC